MVSNTDLQKWQQAINGINETGKADLTKEEWSALAVLNGCLSNGNFSTEESRCSYQTLKDSMKKHGNNPVLYRHLYDFLTLCHKYATVAQSSATQTPPITSEISTTPIKNNPKDSRKGNALIRTVIVIAVVLIAGYVFAKNSEWFNNLFSNEEQSTNQSLEQSLEQGVYTDSDGLENKKNPLYGRIFDFGYDEELTEIPELNGFITRQFNCIKNNYLIFVAEDKNKNVILGFAETAEKKWKLLDTLNLGKLKYPNEIILSMCLINSKEDDEIIAVVVDDDVNEYYYERIVKAWRVDTKAEKIISIKDIKGIKCPKELGC